jgi:hypothetical protein
MRYVVIILGVLALAGCKSQEEQLALDAQRDHEACANMGYEKGTALYLECRQLVTSNRIVAQAKAEEASRNFGNALLQTSAALKNINRQPVNTDCRQTFGGFNCTTW